jgi:uncharacterized protein YidB (DUF937 family)
MSLLDTLVSAFTGKHDTANITEGALGAALTSLLAQNGGIGGLMSKFSQGGLGDVFSSWVGMDKNKSISADQLHSLLGPDQLNSIASAMGIDSSKAAGLLAEHLPKVIDKLTPSGQVEAGADSPENIASLLPSLLSSLKGEQQ